MKTLQINTSWEAHLKYPRNFKEATIGIKNNTNNLIVYVTGKIQ